MRRTVNSAVADAHKQELSTNGILLMTISTLANETYSPPRSLTKSFFRSKTLSLDQNEKKKSEENVHQ